ncbi:TPA_inf: hypothetical protein gp_16 [Marinomonas phage YY]|uniref:Peptidase M15 n=1 Tax=Marinomonas phage YY TaxID=2163588 RepID=A0A2S1GTR8_9VIRU|nr:peptidase M15 [Marinomonas phage YY]DBA35679.1 TPA_inf: hypothetical protein gp_16 [Marinomonas phage YY]
MRMQHFITAPDVTPDDWRERWPNFEPQEFACRCCGAIIVSESLLDMLQLMRDEIGAPIQITSGYRCPSHNAAVGGAPQSEHMNGNASDIITAAHDPLELIRLAEDLGAGGIGEYADKGFLHVDVRPRHGAIARFGSQQFPRNQNSAPAPVRRRRFFRKR